MILTANSSPVFRSFARRTIAKAPLINQSINTVKNILISYLLIGDPIKLLKVKYLPNLSPSSYAELMSFPTSKLDKAACCCSSAILFLSLLFERIIVVLRVKLVIAF